MDRLRQLLQCELFAQQVNPGIAGAIMDDGVARVAGGVEHLQAGLAFAGFVGQLLSADLGHDHVGDQEHDIAAAF